MPAQATIAPLSVHSFCGGATSGRPAWAQKRASASRIAPLAATPPATTTACGGAEPLAEAPERRPAAGPRSRRPPPPETRRRDRRRRAVAAARRSRGEADGGLEPGEREIGIRRPNIGRGRAKRVGIAGPRRRFDRRAAGIGQAQQLGGLVESLADRVVHRRAEPVVVADALDGQNLRMAARGEQQQIGEGDPAARRATSAWASRWLTATNGLPVASAKPLPAIRPTSTPPISPGPADAATPSRSWRPSGLRQGAGDQHVDDLDMGARGDLRHHAAIGRMGGDLAHHLVGENLARAVGRSRTTRPRSRRRSSRCPEPAWIAQSRRPPKRLKSRRVRPLSRTARRGNGAFSRLWLGGNSSPVGSPPAVVSKGLAEASTT